MIGNLTTSESVTVNTTSYFTVSPNFTAPVSTNFTAPVLTNFATPVSTNFTAPVSTNYTTTVPTNFTTPVFMNYTIPVSTNFTAPVSTNNTIPVSTNFTAPVSTNTSVFTNFTTLMSTNFNAPLSTNFTTSVFTNFTTLMSTNFNAPLSTNFTTSVFTNFTTLMSTNFTAPLSTNFTTEFSTNFTVPEIVETYNGFNGLLGIVLMSIIIILNTIGLVLIYKNTELEPRIKVGIIGHAVSDLTLGVVYEMLAVFDKLDIEIDYTICVFSSSCVMTLSLVTGIVSVLQALDQFLILKITFIYTKWISPRKMVVGVVIIYVVSILSSVMIFTKEITLKDQCHLETIINDKYPYIILILNICICTLIMVPMYAYIAYTIRRLVRQEAVGNVLAGDELRRGRREKQIKTTVTLVLIVGLYVLCYIPMAAFLIKLVFIDWTNRPQIYPSRLSRIAGILFLVNSGCNPLIYIVRLRSSRAKCSTGCLPCCRNN